METSNEYKGPKEMEEEDFSHLADHIEESEFNLSDEKEAQEHAGPEGKEEEKTEQAQLTSEGVSLGEILPASFVLNLTNIIFPVLIVKGYKLSGLSAKKEDYKLNAAETKALDGPLQKYLDYVKINLKHPLYNLMLAVSIVYGAKIIDVHDKAEKMKKRESRAEDNLKPVPDEQATKEHLDSLIENQDWMEGFNDEQINLIKATRKRRNKSYDDAIDWLRKKNQL